MSWFKASLSTAYWGLFFLRHRLLASAEPKTTAALREKLAKEFRLTPEELAERTGRAVHRLFANHVAWALVHLQEERLVERQNGKTLHGDEWVFR